MTERDDRLASIAHTIEDYRAGEIARPSPDHVNRWSQQFDKGVQLQLLRELDHVLKKTYLNRETVETFLRGMVKSEKLAGEDPCAFC